LPQKCQPSRIFDYTLHAFRRTFATMHDEDNGVSVNTLKAWLGHKDIETTMRHLESTSASAPHIQDTVNKRRWPRSSKNTS